MAKEIQFMRAGQYKAGGITHLKHVLREKYDQNRIPVPDIRLSKWENGSFVEASKQELHELYTYNMEHRQRKNANVFWEYMLSGYDSEKTAEVAKYLCNFFDNRTVFAIEHRDEGHYHTHFIVFCKDFAHEKSPNIPKGKLHRIRWDLGKITGQKVKERGTGLQKHVGPSSDVSYQAAALMKEDEIARRYRNIQAQIQPVLEMYGAVRIFALNREKGLRFEVWNGSGRKVFTDVDQLPMRKLDQISQKEGEELYFQPVPVPVNGKLCVKAIFLDDVPQPEALPDGTVIVQTSPGKYQAHIPLPQPMPIEEAGKIQRALVYYFGSDAASKDILHLRRLTGFPNKKYLQQPIVALLDIVSSDISVNDILQKVKIEEEQYKKHVEFEFRQVKPWVYKEAQEILANEGKKLWDSFFDGDESAADFSFCLSLIRRGYNPQSVALALMQVSPDLGVRKKKHVEDYIQRTVERAWNAVKTPQAQQQEQREKKL
jgi:hypothetical protein